jgi:hypothetical protein
MMKLSKMDYLFRGDTMRTQEDMINESIKRQEFLQDARKEAERKEKSDKIKNNLLTFLLFPVVFVGLLIIGLGSKKEE